MRIPFRLLFALTLFCCSMSVLDWSWSLHADPWDAADFAAQQVQPGWRQTYFAENAGKEYQANYHAPDGRFVIVKVKKTEAGWQLVSKQEGKAEWHVADSR